MQKEIPIFFGVDDSYAPFLGVALNSAIKNCSPSRKYKAIVLYQELKESNYEKLKSLETENFAIEFVAMQNELESITDRMSNRLRCDYFTLTIYFRIFIPAMFPQYEKAIYIDSDVVLNSDIAELYDTEIGDNYIGACSDKSIVDVPPLVHYVENAVGIKIQNYINSGVLLMDLNKLREKKLETKFLDLLNTYHIDCIAPDQDYINALCKDKIYYLGEEWDTMPNENHPELKNPKLIHYNLFSKPWCYDNIQYEDKFWKYAEDSGYIDEIREFKESYSEEQKNSDTECLGLLVSRGNEIPNNEITFKKLLESGVKVQL